MACTKILSLNAGGDTPMDDAVYDSLHTVIVGVRGTRVYRCNPVTGDVQTQSDLPELGLGGSCIIYDSGTCLVSSWNTSHYDFAAFGSVRNFYRIRGDLIGTAPFLQNTIPFGSTFGLDAFAILDTPACGLWAMKNVGGVVYALGLSSKDQESYVIAFSAASPGTAPDVVPTGGYATPSIAYASVGGNDTAFWCSPGGGYIASWDFDAGVGNTGPVDGSKGYVAIEYSPISNQLYVTREFRYIDVYSTALAPILTIDTNRTDFQGVGILRNPFNVNGFIYVAGGADNSVAIINPGTNGLASPVLTGYDLPWKFCFTPTVKFAVQQGATGLKVVP